MGKSFLWASVVIAFSVACGGGQAAGAPSPTQLQSPGPLAEFLEMGDLVRVCMREQGFEYRDLLIFTPPPDPFGAVALSDADARGYGVTLAAATLDLAASAIARNAKPQDLPAAYLEAFYGAGSDEHAAQHRLGLDHDHGDDDGDDLGAGCLGQAESAIASAYGTPTFAATASVADDIARRVEASGQYRDEVADWARCFREAGFVPASSPIDQAREFSVANLDRLSDHVPVVPDGVATTAASEDELLAFIAADATLSAMLDEEIAQARVDRRCREGFVQFYLAEANAVAAELGLPNVFSADG